MDQLFAEVLKNPRLRNFVCVNRKGLYYVIEFCFGKSFSPSSDETSAFKPIVCLTCWYEDRLFKNPQCWFSSIYRHIFFASSIWGFLLLWRELISESLVYPEAVIRNYRKLLESCIFNLADNINGTNRKRHGKFSKGHISCKCFPHREITVTFSTLLSLSVLIRLGLKVSLTLITYWIEISRGFQTYLKSVLESQRRFYCYVRRHCGLWNLSTGII